MNKRINNNRGISELNPLLNSHNTYNHINKDTQANKASKNNNNNHLWDISTAGALVITITTIFGFIYNLYL